MENVTQTVVDFAMETGFDDLPDEVKQESKRVLLDSLGCALGGIVTDKGRYAIRLARKLQGPPESTIIGIGDKVSSGSAAFANGELINALDMDAILSPPGHVAPYVIPACLALAESEWASGKDLILAIALGHEISIRIAAALTRMYSTDSEGKLKVSDVFGFDSSILGGIIGCGKILELDREKMLHAMGIAAYATPIPAFIKWGMTPPAAMTKYTSTGWVSLAEVIAALLAEMGYTGDTSVLDGDYGFWKMFASDKWEPNIVTEKLGKEWQFLGISYKPYPCCRCMHGALDSFIEIMEENNLTPQDIESVGILAHPLDDLPLWQNVEITTHIDAQFSVPYNFAVAAYGINLGADWQDPRVMKDPRILDFMKKVSHGLHPDWGKARLQDPRSMLSSVEVTAKGQTFKKEKTWAKGDPSPEEGKMKDEELEAKFRSNASKILDEHKIEEAVKTVFELEKAEDISELLEYLSL